jgi:NhaP-type Na+/H+ or K+/H+ antiporter
LPFVLIFLSLLEGSAAELGVVTSELLAGVCIGVAIPYVALKLEQSRHFAASAEYRPLNAVAIGLLVLAVSESFHANLFLAAFAAGVTMATVGPETREAFHRFGNLIAELLKLAALLLLGALISPSWFTAFPAAGYVFIVAVIVLIRPASVGLAMLRSSLRGRERAVASWFGPKGFASMAYGLLLYHSAVGDRVTLFHWIAVTVAVSIVAHSSTDVLIARWMQRGNEAEAARDGRAGGK